MSGQAAAEDLDGAARMKIAFERAVQVYCVLPVGVASDSLAFHLSCLGIWMCGTYVDSFLLTRGCSQ